VTAVQAHTAEACQLADGVWQLRQPDALAQVQAGEGRQLPNGARQLLQPDAVAQVQAAEGRQLSRQPGGGQSLQQRSSAALALSVSAGIICPAAADPMQRGAPGPHWRLLGQHCTGLQLVALSICCWPPPADSAGAQAIWMNYPRHGSRALSKADAAAQGYQSALLPPAMTGGKRRQSIPRSTGGVLEAATQDV
jgi:hypothetical protein